MGVSESFRLSMHEVLPWTSQRSSISFVDGEQLMVVRLLQMEFDRVLDTLILMRRAIRPGSQGLD